MCLVGICRHPCARTCCEICRRNKTMRGVAGQPISVEYKLVVTSSALGMVFSTSGICIICFEYFIRLLLTNVPTMQQMQILIPTRRHSDGYTRRFKKKDLARPPNDRLKLDDSTILVVIFFWVLIIAQLKSYETISWSSSFSSNKYELLWNASNSWLL